MYLHAYTALCLYAGFLGFLRLFLTDDNGLGGLIWNLILAVIPYFFALMAVKSSKKYYFLFGFLWLLFFPNALYIFTDFIHLGKDPTMIHYDIVYISAVALAGLIAGFASLELIHTYWNRHYHRVIGWCLVSGIMILSLFGVYLGRFLRFNSWDIVREPMNLFREMLHVLISPNMLPEFGDPLRSKFSELYGANPLNVYGFIAIYFGLYMLLYIFLYHSRKAK